MAGFYASHPYKTVHVTGRSCARCGQPLTDAASMEEGIGPVCRKLDNSVLARLFPSDVPAARVAFGELHLDGLPPETLSTMIDIESALDAPDAAACLDWRKVIKKIEWVLSFTTNHATRASLTRVVRSLGYVGLASLWDGNASTGPCHVAVVGQNVYLAGSNVKAGRIAFKKAGATLLQSWHGAGLFEGFVPPEFKGKSIWGMPLPKFKQFKQIVLTHWVSVNPVQLQEAELFANATIGEVPAIGAVQVQKPSPMISAEEVAAAFKGMNDAVAATMKIDIETVPVKPTIQVYKSGIFLRVKTPKYNPAYIAAVKTLPKSDRRWLGEEKMWEIAAIHEPQVTAWIKDYFKADPEFIQQ